MKLNSIVILGVFCCALYGCSTNSKSSGSDHEDTAAANSLDANQSSDRLAEHANIVEKVFQPKGEFSRDYLEKCAKADIVLEGTYLWGEFEETKPVRATVKLEGLRNLIRNGELPGQGVAVVVFPDYARIFKPGQEDPLNNFVAKVRQILKDAGFVRIYCYGIDHGVDIIPFRDNPK